MPDVKPKLGILFVINYFVYTNTKAGILLNSHIDDIENGFFNLGSYRYDETVKYCFIKSMRELNSDGTLANNSNPATKIYIPEYCKTENKYKVKPDKPDAFLGYINLGNHDVLSTVLIMVEQMINADEYIIITYSHGSPFGIGNGNIDETSKITAGSLTPFPFNGVVEIKAANLMFADFKTPSLKLNVDYISGVGSPDFEAPGIFNNMTPGIAVLNEDIDSNKSIDIAGFLDTEAAPAPMSNIKNKEDEFKDSIENFKPDMLTNAEQHVALGRAFPSGNIKILINCACYVQNVDTLFSLRQVTDYIVAASSSIPELSFDFAKIINQNIAGNTTRDYRLIAQNIVSTYNYLEILKPFEDKITGDEITKDKIKEPFRRQNNHIILSAIDCKQLDLFFEVFNEFLLLLINQIADKNSFEKLRIAKINIALFEMERIKKLVNKNESISKIPFYMYDLKVFIDSLKKENPLLIQKINTVSEFFDNDSSKKIVLQKFVSPSLLENQLATGRNWGGVAFYFPDEINVSKSLTGLSKFYSVFSSLESFFSKKGYLQEFIFLYHKRNEILPSTT